MTISSEIRKEGPYDGDGVVTSFPFYFKIFKAEDVLVVRADSAGAETTLVLNSDYTVTLAPDQNTSPGGTVVLAGALMIGTTLTIASRLLNLQPVDLTNQGGFYPRVINDALDRLTILVQQLAERVSRSLKMAISTPSGVDPQLPAPTPETLIGWNSQGTGFVNVNRSDAALYEFSQAGIGAVRRSVESKLRDTVSVKDFGAVGDGVTDDTAAVQAALDSGCPVVVFPAGDYLWGGNGPVVRSGTKVVGMGARIIQYNFDPMATISTGVEYAGLRIAVAEDIEISGLVVEGPFASDPVQAVYRSIGIAVSGRYDQYFYDNPNYPANPPNPVSGTSRNIRIVDCDIKGFGQSGIVADQIIGLTVANNLISRCGRDGVRMYGVRDFDVSHNQITDMAPGFSGEGIAPNYNVYGITATRIYHCTAADGTLTDYPPSAYGSISHNIVRRCLTWKALDTHGGTDILFDHNIISGSHIGIGLDKGGFDLTDGFAPPRRLKLLGNIVIADPTNAAGNRAGIFAVAHDATDQNFGEDLEISGNHVEGYGEQNRDGNIVVSNYRRVVIDGFTIRNGLRSGINLQGAVEDYTIGNGVIQDIGMTSVGSCIGINLQASNQRGMINGVAFRKTDTSDIMTAISSANPNAGYGAKVGQDLSFYGNVTFFNATGSTLRHDSPFITKPIAWGNINNTGTAFLSSGKGIMSVVRTSAGVVRVALSSSTMSTLTFMPMAVGKGGSAIICSCSIIDASTVDVTTCNDSGAVTDASFFFAAFGF